MTRTTDPDATEATAHGTATVATGIADQSRFAAALADPAAPLPPGIRARSHRAAASRFEVYRNNVGSSLVTALGHRFPVVKALVGEAFFRAMARVHVDRSRPRSPVLARYGDDFPAFVEGFPPASGVPYLADVARLECAVSAAYHAAEAPALTPAALAAIDPAGLPALRFRPHPAATLVVSSHPVGSIWSAHQTGGQPGRLPAFGETILVTRPAAEVHVTSLRPADAAFAGAVLSGAGLEEAAESGFEADAAFDFGRSLVGLVDLGALLDSGTEGEDS